MFKQRGITLGGMIFAAISLALMALLLLKTIPTYVEYFGLKSIVKGLITEKAGSPPSVIREAFAPKADIQNIKAISAQDLQIDPDGRGITVEYQRVVPVVANISLLFDFKVEERAKGAAMSGG